MTLSPAHTTPHSQLHRDPHLPPPSPVGHITDTTTTTTTQRDNTISNRYDNHHNDDNNTICTCPTTQKGTNHIAAAALRTLRTCKSVVAAATVTPLQLLRRIHRKHRSGRQVPHVLCTLFLLMMLAGRSLASPWIQESPHSVKLRAQFCRPVSEEHLRNMLGAAYDPSRMANLDPAASKRSDSDDLDHQGHHDLEGEGFDTYYMDDDPNAGRYFDEDIVDIVTEREGEGGWVREEEQEDFVEEKPDFEGMEEGGLYNKKWLDSESPLGEHSTYQQRDRTQGQDQSRGQGRNQGQGQGKGQLYNYMYMRRRRRATNQEQGSTEASGQDSSKREKKSKDSLIPLRLLLSGRNRKLRRKLKKEFRKKARKLANKPPPWECQLKKVWGRLKDGYFPQYLLDGRCMTDKCFYRLYDCLPQQYPVKVLKRDPDYCNPLPTIGANSTYEQRWTIVRYYVTVGCKCSTTEQQQRSSSGRRRKS